MATTYKNGFEEYFGTIHEVARMPLPFTCKVCKKSYTTILDDGDEVNAAIMSVADIWKHIRKAHRVLLKKQTLKRECVICHVTIKSGRLCEEDIKQFPAK